MAAAAGGSVSYFHAGGIDRPLVITKDGQSIIPHQNWRGQLRTAGRWIAFRATLRCSTPLSAIIPLGRELTDT